MSRHLEKLVGKTLRSVSRGKWVDHLPPTSKDRDTEWAQNTDTITFHCDDGDYVFRADGDCCSQTFIESVEGPTAGKVLAVQQPEWGDPVRVENNDELKFYKATFVIEGAGHLDVEYRNESNGYYGGSLELLSKPEPCTAHEDCAAYPELGAACKAAEHRT